MPINKEAYLSLKNDLDAKHVTLVAVSKTKPVEDIRELYDLGHRDFGENYAQEMLAKSALLPPDIRWHFIGHLQSNKVKLIAPFVQLIQSVDSLKLLEEIDKQAAKAGRIIDCLLQAYIAEEETKFGMDEKELEQAFSSINKLRNVKILGLMGMASLTADIEQVRKEFRHLKVLFEKHAKLQIPNSQLLTLSMGMSGDYRLAMEEGSTMVRIGSLIFGERN